MYMSYYGSFVLQCYVLRMRVMTSTIGGNLSNRPPALRQIHVKKYWFSDAYFSLCCQNYTVIRHKHINSFTL